MTKQNPATQMSRRITVILYQPRLTWVGIEKQRELSPKAFGRQLAAGNLAATGE
jgi:hypothetical protein